MTPDLLHFDPITVIIVITGVIVTWANLRKDSKWHGAWIKKHSEECDRREGQVTSVLLEMRTSNVHLETLVTAHHDSIQRIDGEIVRVRDRIHDLANDVQKARKI